MASAGVADFGAGDFTIEFWHRPASLNAYPLGCYPLSGGAVAFYAYLTTEGALQFNIQSGATYIGGQSANGVVGTATLTHMAFVRDGENLRIFVSGVQVFTTAALGTSAVNASAAPLCFGMLDDGGTLPGPGYYDDIRVTKGVARYTANFMPPTESFDDFLLVTTALSGNVKDAAGNNAARLVRAYREDTGVSVGSATSNATTGNYVIGSAYGGGHTLNFYPAAGEGLNVLSLRGVVPV